MSFLNPAPGDRSTPEDQKDEEIYIIEGSQRDGPFSMKQVCILIRGKKIARDALYWKQGMTNARPISELDDEVTILTPRNHHYHFAYTALPEMLFTSTKFVYNLVSGDPDKPIRWVWDQAAEVYANSDADPSTGLKVERLPYDAQRVLLLVTMPSPHRDTEAYFAAAILPKADAKEPLSIPRRYFVLSHFGGLGEDFPEGRLREVSKEGNVCVKEMVEPLREDFLNAVKEVCPPNPDTPLRSWFKR